MADGTVLVTSYHPSRQNTHTGRLTRPMWEAIFRRAKALLDENPAASASLHGRARRKRA
jgi:uracil-DNA glycosylase